MSFPLGPVHVSWSQRGDVKALLWSPRHPPLDHLPWLHVGGAAQCPFPLSQGGCFQELGRVDGQPLVGRRDGSLGACIYCAHMLKTGWLAAGPGSRGWGLGLAFGPCCLIFLVHFLPCPLVLVLSLRIKGLHCCCLFLSPGLFGFSTLERLLSQFC